ncbi:Ribosome biogenesis protein bms1 [Erysiphe necator]|uniref:Putative aarp2cn domain-containing protein n=1 Tax=Uncinula necator TaxID=52586 RepID=A0A0B1PAM2_UNCNE|nr:Ribosome biogenesis protein bms1 [Erysiphe necator]KHJ34021.1 putative aarp2cn domain-containing protein [Erysiphe necator]
MEQQANAPHRPSKTKKKHTGDRNPKAFSFSNPGRLSKTAARSHDIREKKLHVPQVDRLPDEPPPRLVAIVGPPGVGKTTLLKSLIKRYAKETLSEPQGPITVITSKRQRLTLIECPTQLEAMMDISKVADIILLMIDGKFGFEMETMEFLNILAASGMPGNVFGILTHLDLFQKPQTLKDTKKKLKNRFWSELYQGAHLFYLSGVINGRYPDREIHNISRFISVMKNPRPLIWRNSHPYSLIDSFRDITHPTKIESNPKCDRTVVLCGYLRGTNFAPENQRIHIPGLGDFSVSRIETLPDPCPTPYMDQAIAKASGSKGRKRLDEKDKKLHAPMSDRGGLKVDGDVIWITKEKDFSFDKDAVNKDLGEGEELIINLQHERKLLGQTEQGLRLFSGEDTVINKTDIYKSERDPRRKAFADEEIIENNIMYASLDESSDQSADKDTDESIDQSADESADKDTDESTDESVDQSADDNIEEEDSDEMLSARWKENSLLNMQRINETKRPLRTFELSKMIYDTSLSTSEALGKFQGKEDTSNYLEDNKEDIFFEKSKIENEIEENDRVMSLFNYEELEKKWTLEENVENLRRRFTNSELLPKEDKISQYDSDEGDGHFEDLEQLKPSDIDAERETNARRKEELKLRFEIEDREGLNNEKAQALKDNADNREFGEDEWYEAQKANIQKQLNINKAELEALDDNQRLNVEGFPAGKYAKITIDGVSSEFVTKFNPKMPIIAGGLNATEDRFGFVEVRIKRHRWHKKILKTNDPLIFSMGWRRFQTIPIYSTSDSRVRKRMLKYTPEHTHCFATFYGPLISPNTGFSCVRSLPSKEAGFRVAATGTVLNVEEGTEIVKKLKLTGTPYKIFKNTAFIKDMFTTSVEIAKYEGALIRTVSGVRGQIKKALSKPEGHFRATFEDKILMSDIVFLRTWCPVKPHRFYSPVTNLIGWTGMRLTGEVRMAEGLKVPQQENSVYRPIKRVTRNFNPLKVPQKLAAELPFKSQITRMKKQKDKTYMQKRAVVLGGEEKAARDLMQKLMTLRNDKIDKRRKSKEANREAFRKKQAKNAEKREERTKKESQEYWRNEGKKRKTNTDETGPRKRGR